MAACTNDEGLQLTLVLITLNDIKAKVFQLERKSVSARFQSGKYRSSPNITRGPHRVVRHIYSFSWEFIFLEIILDYIEAFEWNLFCHNLEQTCVV